MRYFNDSTQARDRARELRKNMGAAERRLWKELHRDFLGFRFRRQVPIGPYILDFYCVKAKLCLEVDGDLHAERQDKDTKRDAYLAHLGILTVRLWTNYLYENMPGVIEDIHRICLERTKSP
jgi:very-short-patch-repair endonuclease